MVTAIGGYVTGVDPYTYITTEFLVDKAFGFIVETTNTDNNNLVFSGIINTIE